MDKKLIVKEKYKIFLNLWLIVKKKERVISFGMILSLLLLLFSHWLNISWSSKELFKVLQSDEINYNSFDPYYLVVTKEQRSLSTRLKIKIISEALYEAGAGYSASFNYFDDSCNEYNLKEQLKKAKVLWIDMGVVFEVPVLIDTQEETNFDNKIRLFIPKESFINEK